MRSEPSDPRRLRNLVPVALLLAAVAVGLFLVLRRGGSGEAPPDRGGPNGKNVPDVEFPDWFSAECRDAVEALRTSLGADAGALVTLRGALPDDGKRRAEFYRMVQPELLLAVRGGDPECGAHVLELLAAGLSGDPSDLADRVVRSPGFAEIPRMCAKADAPALRAKAAAHFAKLGTPAARADLIPLLGDPDPEVRAAAVSAYATMSRSGGGARLCDLYRAEEEEAVRSAILRALGSRRAFRTTAAHEIEAAVLTGGTTSARIQVLASIAVFRDHVPRTGIESLLSHPSAAIRAEALKTVLALRSTVFADAVEARVAAEENEKVRALAESVLNALR